MNKEPSISSQADAIDTILRIGVLHNMKKTGLRLSEIEHLVERLQSARSTLRFLAPLQKDLREWIESRGQSNA